MATAKRKPKPKDRDIKRTDKAKGKKAKKGTGGEQAGTVYSIAAHPKARASVARAKGWGGLFGFAAAAVLSLKAGVPPLIAGERALIAGLIGYLVGWTCSVTVWRALMVVELKVAHERLSQRRAEAAAAGAGQATVRKD